jgi:hypothetical protein
MPEPTPPYLLPAADLSQRIDDGVNYVFSHLASQFMLLPKGATFLDYEDFLDAYETLRIQTDGFACLTTATCWAALRQNARAWIVLRTIMGISPPEWGDLANELEHSSIPTNWCRGIDGKAKSDPTLFAENRDQSELMLGRVTVCLTAAAEVLSGGSQSVQTDGVLHRLDKFDTRGGLATVEHAAQHGAPYAVLLYERFLGRPFASHRDAVSELVGDVMESAIEKALSDARIPFRKTRRAERVPGFEQAPDFFIPDEIAPSIIIEAKVCGDDGTARDKVSRVLRLAQMRDERERSGRRTFQVIACVDGRGFSVRRQDMRDLILATQGNVFTLSMLQDLVPNTALQALIPQGRPH